MTQLAIPAEVSPDEVSRKKSLGASIELCAEIAGFELDKQLQDRLGVDKGQFSRWTSNQEGVKWEKLEHLMDVCGNDAPLMWMLHRRGYDITSIRKRETLLEKSLREEREKSAKLAELLEIALQGRKP